MTVKDRVGRVRHVAFRLHADRRVGRRELEDAVRQAVLDRFGDPGLAAMQPQLTAYDGQEGLVRVRHHAAAEAREALNGTTRGRHGPLTIETLGTSGTMRAARRKWLSGEAAIRRRPRR